MAFFKPKPRYPGLRAAGGTILVGMLLEVGGLIVRSVHGAFHDWSERKALERASRKAATAQPQYRANV